MRAGSARTSASELVDAAVRGEREDREAVRMARDDVERAGADRAGRAEDADALHHAARSQPSSASTARRPATRQQRVDAIEHAAVAGQQLLLDP